MMTKKYILDFCSEGEENFRPQLEGKKILTKMSSAWKTIPFSLHLADPHSSFGC